MCKSRRYGSNTETQGKQGIPPYPYPNNTIVCTNNRTPFIVQQKAYEFLCRSSEAKQNRPNRKLTEQDKRYFGLDTDLAFVNIWGGQYGVPFDLALRGTRYAPGGMGCLQECLQVGHESCPGARTINNHERLIGKPPPVERSSRASLDPCLWGRTFAFDPLPPGLGPGSRVRPPNFFRSIAPPLTLNELALFCPVIPFSCI